MRVQNAIATLITVALLLGVLPHPTLAQSEAAPHVVVAVPGPVGDRLATRMQAALDQAVEGAVVERYTGPVTSAEAAKRVGLYFGAALIVWQDENAPSALNVTTEWAGAPEPLQTGQLTTDDSRAEAAAIRTITGQALSRMGNCAAAIPQFDRAQALASPDWAGLVELRHFRGLCYAFAGDTAAALANLEAATATGAVPWYVYYASAWVYANQGAYAQAIEATSRALDLLPENAILYADRAYYHTQTGAVIPALTDYDTALALAPADPILLLARARLLTIQGDYGAALRDLDAALTGDPFNRDELLFQRGLVQLYRGDFGAAVSDLSAYTSRRPEDAAGWINLGQAHEGLGETFSAIQAYETALLNDPAATHLYTTLARLYYEGVAAFEAGSPQAADYLALSVNAASAALTTYPEDTSALLYRALAHMGRRQNELALEDLSRAIDLDSAFAAAHYNRAVVYTRLGYAALDDSERAGLLRAALGDYGTLFRIDFAAYNYLLPYAGYLHVDLGEFEAALEHFSSYDDLYPEQILDPLGGLYRGRTYRALNDPEAALAAYALALTATDPAYVCEAQLSSGMLLGIELQDRPSAAHYLEQYLASGCAPNPVSASLLSIQARGWAATGQN